MVELVFEVTQEADGGYSAECLTENIFTQGDTWDDLRFNVREAVGVFYFDLQKPAHSRSPTGQSYHSGNGNSNASQNRWPAHKSLRIGTLNSIIRQVAAHKAVSKQDVLDTL